VDALSSNIDEGLRLTKLDIAAVDIGLNSVREEMATYPRAVDHDFILDRMSNSSSPKDSRSTKIILKERPGQIYIRDSCLVSFTNVDSPNLHATRATHPGTKLVLLSYRQCALNAWQVIASVTKSVSILQLQELGQSLDLQSPSATTRLTASQLSKISTIDAS